MDTLCNPEDESQTCGYGTSELYPIEIAVFAAQRMNGPSSYDPSNVTSSDNTEPQSI